MEKMSSPNELTTVLNELTTLFIAEGCLTDDLTKAMEQIRNFAEGADEAVSQGCLLFVHLLLTEFFPETHRIYDAVNFRLITLYEHGGVLHKQGCEGGCGCDLSDVVSKLKFIMKKHERLTPEIEAALNDFVCQGQQSAPENLAEVWQSLHAYVMNQFPTVGPSYEADALQEDIFAVFLLADLAIG
jgi:hypothetical protein